MTIKIIVIVFLFSTGILLSQDSLSKITYPKLTVHNRYTKNAFTINWPLRNFENQYVFEIYYETNYISRRTFKKIIDVEPDLHKKQELFIAYKNIGNNKRRESGAFWSGACLITIGYFIAFDGLYGRYGHDELILRESIGGSLFLTGIICEVAAIVFNKKRKKATKNAVTILNS